MHHDRQTRAGGYIVTYLCPLLVGDPKFCILEPKFRSTANEIKCLVERIFPEKTGFPRVGEPKTEVQNVVWICSCPN